MCKADWPLALSCERRKTLPSIATTPWHCRENAAMNRWNAAPNLTGSSSRNSRLNVSWLGNPLLRLRNSRRNDSFAFANSAISVAF